MGTYRGFTWKLGRVPDAKLVAVCDLDPDLAARAAAMIPEARAYTDSADLFEREEALDFVEICTQPESHRELVEQAARRGLDILCQKPAATARSDFRAMIDACLTTGVRLMIHENWRFRPWYRAMRREIDSGAIGRPLRLADRPPRYAGLASGRLCGPALPEEDAQAYLDGCRVSPGRHGSLPDR